jgi:creatinine amidohydrolase
MGTDASVSWAEQTSARLRELAPRLTAVIPIGATEQHGDHLPVGTDHLVIAELCSRAAGLATTEDRPVLVTPVIAYGASHHHLPRAGTLSLRSETALAVLRDVMASMSVTGVRRIVVLNGHGGNEDLIRQAVRDVCLEHPVTASAASYWTVSPDLATLAADHGISIVPGHAGSFEQSLVLSMRPELVDSGPRAPRAAVPEPVAFEGLYTETHRWIDRIHGVSDAAEAASATAGDALVDHLTARLAAVLREVAASDNPAEEAPR